MCKENKCLLPVIIATILGILSTILFYTGIISTEIIGTPIIFATTFAGISILLLFLLAAFGIKRKINECLVKYGKCLIVSGIGTLIVGFFALTYISLLAEASIASAILIGVGVFFTILNFSSFTAMLVCLLNDKCEKRNPCEFNN